MQMTAQTTRKDCTLAWALPLCHINAAIKSESRRLVSMHTYRIAVEDLAVIGRGAKLEEHVDQHQQQTGRIGGGEGAICVRMRA